MATILSKAELAYQLGKVHNYLLKCEKLLDEANVSDEESNKALLFLMSMCEKQITGLGARQ